jgi:hypothetical protein
LLLLLLLLLSLPPHAAPLGTLYWLGVAREGSRHRQPGVSPLVPLGIVLAAVPAFAFWALRLRCPSPLYGSFHNFIPLGQFRNAIAICTRASSSAHNMKTKTRALSFTFCFAFHRFRLLLHLNCNAHTRSTSIPL